MFTPTFLEENGCLSRRRQLSNSSKINPQNQQFITQIPVSSKCGEFCWFFISECDTDSSPPAQDLRGDIKQPFLSFPIAHQLFSRVTVGLFLHGCLVSLSAAAAADGAKRSRLPRRCARRVSQRRRDTEKTDETRRRGRGSSTKTPQGTTKIPVLSIRLGLYLNPHEEIKI